MINTKNPLKVLSMTPLLSPVFLTQCSKDDAAESSIVITTHMKLDAQYLANKGITIPKNKGKI
jgi:hypothetical protein